jgi:hypothetical protein
MTREQATRSGKRRTASELRKLPPKERDAILEAAAIQVEADYLNDPDLTAFEASGGIVLPGFTLVLQDLFAELDRQG